MRLTTFMATRNHGKYLGDAVRSCLTQTRPPDQLIIIDDESTDDTKDITSELRKIHGIEIVEHKERRGNIESYNEGIERSTGDFIHLMAADDVLADPTFYETSLRILKDPSIGFVTGSLRWMDERGRQMEQLACPPFEGRVHSKEILHALSKLGNFICGGAVVIRSSIQKQHPYDERCIYSADFLNWIRVLQDCRCAYFLPRIVYHYRRHNAQMTSGSSASIVEREICQSELRKACEERL